MCLEVLQRYLSSPTNTSSWENSITSHTGPGLVTSNLHILITKSRSNFCYFQVGLISFASNFIRKENIKHGNETSEMCVLLSIIWTSLLCHSLCRLPWKILHWMLQYDLKIYISTVHKLEVALQITLPLIGLWRHGLNCYKCR